MMSVDVSRGRVLVVEDEKLIRWSICERLTRRGYDVISAESGEQGLELISDRPPDVAVFDVRLPGIDGVALLQKALAARPDLVAVMMSAHGTVDLAVEAMKRGAIDFLVKPFPLTALDEVVQRAMGTATTRKRLAQPASGREAALFSIVGDSPQMRALRDVVERVAASSSATVLIEGESGAGKEVVARAIHLASARAARPFVQLNCAALPEQLLESELFGHERGAFTDARVQKRGLFESAEGGSAMLDEIGDMPSGGQAKLLRLLEQKTFRRLGGTAELKADVRVIAATNASLERRVEEGRFRADLFFRLNVVRITVPPLRERRDDIAPLAAFFVARYNEEMQRQVRAVSPPALDLLQGYRWPGNVRELRNAIERAFILFPNATELFPEHFSAELRNGGDTFASTPPSADAAPLTASLPRFTTEGDSVVALEEMEKRLISDAMEKTRGNQSQAARMLGVSRDTLRYRLKKHGLME